MSKDMKGLIRRAFKIHKTIFPCGRSKLFSESFTIENEILVFWFNANDDTTHVIGKKVGSREIICKE